MPGMSKFGLILTFALLVSWAVGAQPVPRIAGPLSLKVDVIPVAAGPMLGYLKDRFGWEGLFYGVVGMCVVAAVTWLFIDCTKRVAAD